MKLKNLQSPSPTSQMHSRGGLFPASWATIGLYSNQFKLLLTPQHSNLRSEGVKGEGGSERRGSNDEQNEGEGVKGKRERRGGRERVKKGEMDRWRRVKGREDRREGEREGGWEGGNNGGRE